MQALNLPSHYGCGPGVLPDAPALEGSHVGDTVIGQAPGSRAFPRCTNSHPPRNRGRNQTSARHA
jgi:hypothetical protein